MRTDGFRLKYCRKAVSVICIGVEFNKNGKANITVLALNLFLTVVNSKRSRLLLNSRAKLLRSLLLKMSQTLILSL